MMTMMIMMMIKDGQCNYNCHDVMCSREGGGVSVALQRRCNGQEHHEESMEMTPMRNADGEEAGGDALRNVSLRLEAFGSCVSKSACDGGELFRGSFSVCLEHHVIDPREEKESWENHAIDGESENGNAAGPGSPCHGRNGRASTAFCESPLWVRGHVGVLAREMLTGNSRKVGIP